MILANTLTPTNVTKLLHTSGSDWLITYGYATKNGQVYPNNSLGQPIIDDYDTLVKGSRFLNLSDCLVRLYVDGDTEPEKTFFNMSNRDIWKTGEGGDWTPAQLQQSAMYENIQPAYKNRLFSKELEGVFKEIFLYASSLTGSNIEKAYKYVGFDTGSSLDFSTEDNSQNIILL